MTQKQLAREISPMEVVLSLRERNRRMTIEEYIEKIGLREKFQQFTGKENHQVL